MPKKLPNKVKETKDLNIQERLLALEEAVSFLEMENEELLLEIESLKKGPTIIIQQNPYPVYPQWSVPLNPNPWYWNGGTSIQYYSRPSNNIQLCSGTCDSSISGLGY